MYNNGICGSGRFIIKNKVRIDNDNNWYINNNNDILLLNYRKSIESNTIISEDEIWKCLI